MIKNDLTEGPIATQIKGLAIPLFFGIAAVILFTVVDTFFIGQLGPTELAAMGFCFPVVFFIQNLAVGLGTGATSVISRAIGAGDSERIRRLTTHSLTLALILVLLVAIGGLFSMDLLFTAMGATAELLPLIRAYLTPWFLGVGLLVIPIVGNSALRASGDTKTPALIMMGAGLINVILDPLLIFGLGPFPRLEIQGAALATVGSWLGAFCGATYFLKFRYKMLTNPFCQGVLGYWFAILRVGLPAAGTNILVPLSSGVLVKMVSDFGNDAVGAYGVAGRVEALCLVGISAVASAMAPFVGQNFGAERYDRIRHALKICLQFSVAWGLASALVLTIFGQGIAQLFSDDQAVILALVPYLGLVPWSYGLLGIVMITTSTFNAADQPLKSSLVIIVRLFVLAIPLAYLGAQIRGLQGLYVGILGANVLTGLFALWLTRGLIKSHPLEKANSIKRALIKD